MMIMIIKIIIVIKPIIAVIVKTAKIRLVIKDNICEN